MRKHTLAVIFSGGGLKGITQLGVLKAIEEHIQEKSLDLKAVVGTSMGSITASLLATGTPAEQVIDQITKKKVNLTSLKDLQLKGIGLIKGQPIRELLEQHLKGKTFNDCQPELKINAVDLLKGEEYVYSKQGLKKKNTKKTIKKHNNIIDAIRASIAVPLIFEPVKQGKLLLADGGVLNPLAIDLIRPADYDEVIVVQTSGSLDYLDPDKPLRTQVIAQTISIMQRAYYFPNLKELLKKQDHIIHIRPPVKPFTRMKKKTLQDAIRRGYEAAKKALED